FSFNGNKTITTGGGGLVISKYRERLKHIKYLVNQAKDYGVEMYHSEIGFNYRMTNISAALGIAQLQRLKEFLQIKKNIHHIYNKELGSISNIKLQAQYDEGDSSWWFTCILMDDERARLQLQDLLQISGIPFRRIFSPVHKFTPFKDCRFSGGDNAETLYKRGICLPSSTLNSEEGIDYVCQVIKRFFQC
ncbi:DegT/DnrJ/EryC1/StrS family aminotransferase, partial [bacterium]|nr:DegT/DnrJ/EryC1/StrS family aminotransferase [bacterium]